MKLFSKLLLLGCILSGTYSSAQSSDTIQNETGSCGSGCCCGYSQAPLGVMTDHIHSKGEWMASYTYMNTLMQGNRTGTAKASDKTVYQNYMMAPEKMTMQMHMAMLMYGVTDRLTLMGMAGFAASNMTMNMAAMTMPGMTMPSSTMASMSSGITDTRVYGLYNFSGKEEQRIIASMGINIPTGIITATGTTMLGDNQRLPYDMQPGTGSLSILPGITYVRKMSLYSFGADAGADIKLNTNALGYKWGNMYHADAWAGYKVLPFLTGSVRAECISADKIAGSDAAIAIPVYEENDPTTRTDNYGGKWINLYIGVNIHFNQRVLNRFSLLAEYGMPVYENLNGTQMSLHANLLAGLQYSF